MKNDDKFPTIRQCANRGPLSEHYLRILLKENRLPGFFCGRHFRVNYPMLLAHLDELSLESAKGGESN